MHISLQVYSQSPSWHRMPGAPFSSSRHEDIYFINALTGWVIHYDGNVYKTTNGGNNWSPSVYVSPELRSTGFFDENTGIIGTLDSLNVLYRTTNGGLNWTEISENIQGTVPYGICGISIVNQTTAYACGRYMCPAFVIKTTNSGLNWASVSVDTSQVRSLIDCYFWSADSGIVVGGYSSSNNYGNGKSVILMTVNGGVSWTRVFVSTRTGEWCWKISNVTRQLMFVSIEGFSHPAFFLKTTNGGLNWTEIQFLNTYNEEGIGFINENTGWIGGWTGPSYQTTNGGTNWQQMNQQQLGFNVNRFRFISDTLGYAVGQSIYKFTREPIGIQQISTEIPKGFSLHQNYPNPFNPTTKIKFEIPKSSFVTIKVYNALGKEISELADENLNAGIYSVSWNASAYPSGIYFYKMVTGENSVSKKMMLIK